MREGSVIYYAVDFRLDGQVALITGAGAGIDRAIAETFASASATMVISDLALDAAESVAAAITARGGRAAAVACDITNEDDFAGVVQKTVRHFDKLTILVSNAGGGPKPFDMPMTDFRRAFDLSVFSLFRLAQLAAPQVQKAGGGAMRAITSMAGENKSRRMASYGASKAAINHLIRNIAFDLGPMGIRINGIAPGATRTAALESVLNDEIEKKMLMHTPIQRLGEPKDMANAALYLCSAAAAWVSGQILTVSGGGVQELD